jgi:hypothetical protein
MPPGWNGTPGYPDYIWDPAGSLYQLSDWSTSSLLTWADNNAVNAYGVRVPIVLPDGLSPQDIVITKMVDMSGNQPAPGENDASISITWQPNGDTVSLNLSQFGAD